MDICEVGETVDNEFLETLTQRLRDNFPDFRIPDSFNHIRGQAKCYKGIFRLPGIVVFYHHNIAVYNEKLKNKDAVISSLQKLGYHVPSREMKEVPFPNREPVFEDGEIVDWVAGRERTITAEEILWDELRAGRGLPLIRQQLESLIEPIFRAVQDVHTYEFAVYNPWLVTSTDDVCPPYIEYDEIFKLPVGDQLIDGLINKIQTIPPTRALAISSRVQTSRGEFHIPMVDFYTENVYYEDVMGALGRLHLPTDFLVNSGNAFHHYHPGQLLTEDGLNVYLDRLAEQEEIGENWPWLQAHQGFSLLRIAPCGKKPHFPEIVNHEDYQD